MCSVDVSSVMCKFIIFVGKNKRSYKLSFVFYFPSSFLFPLFCFYLIKNLDIHKDKEIDPKITYDSDFLC